MRMGRTTLLIGLLVSGVASMAQKAQNGTIRVNTRLVEISVVVRDKSGPLTDLRKEDFAITDNGKPQRVDVFEMYDARTQKQASAGALPRGVTSNLRNAAGEIPKSATVILLDLMNSSNDGVNRDATYSEFRSGRCWYTRTLIAARRDSLSPSGRGWG